MSPSPITLTTRAEHWPIAGSFTISRGAKTEAVVVVAELSDGSHRGRGECVPYARYGETVESVVAAIEAMRPQIAGGLDRAGLQQAMAAGAARNALDCALWDLDAKRAGRPAYELAGIAAPQPLVTAYTISLATPEAMAAAARKAADRALLKVKLGGAGDPERIAAVRRAAPNAELIVDANEAWTQAEPHRQPRRLRGRRRDADRAAAARRPGRRAVRVPASGADLRRRERACARVRWPRCATNTTR